MIFDLLATIALMATLAALPRLLIGPTDGDRILAAQLSGTGTVATLILHGAASQTPALYDVALVFAALSAITGLAFAALRRRGT